MKNSPLFLILGLSGAGLLSGLAARRMTQGASVLAPAPAPVETGTSSGATAPEAAFSKPDKAAPIPVPLPASTDTVEILLAVDDATLYPRLAAWLLGAGEQDIAAYWNGYRTRKNREMYIADLVFINWTRLNPSGAIAAVAGTKDDYFPWWAWTAHDPQAALAAAMATAPKMVDRVARGIGGFHPDWLREHLDQIPEASRSSALSSFKEVGDTENPLETLKFIRENSMDFDKGIFKSLVRKDPWEAFEWIQQNPSLQTGRYRSENGPLDVLLDTMITDHPDDLKRLVAQTPSGEMKRKMEAAIFENLLETDPAAAIAQAKATDSAVIAAERFAKIGLGLIKTDPDQAFEMARKLMAINPGRRDTSMRVEYPNGSSSWGGNEDGSSELVAALIARDPARLMEIAIPPDGVKPNQSQFFSWATHQWANQDLVSYTNWVNQQTDPGIRESAVGPVVSQLSQLGQFTEAIEWARGSETTENSYLYTIFYQWGRVDPAGAAGWLETSGLSAEKAARLQENIKQASSQNDE